MSVDLKSLLYSKIQLIQSKEIQEFVKVSLDNAPAYFWTLKASTSGKYHHGETLVEHILYALEYGQAHIRMLQWYWDEETKDLFFAALFLHDLYRCGIEGRESMDEDGFLRTDNLHPVYAASELSRLEMPSKTKVDDPFFAYRFSWFKKFQKAVASHLGPWSPLKELSPMHDNMLSLRLNVFLVDYVVSRQCQRTTIPELEEE
ncbi:MAG: HD domain-containing protein [Anaerolineales bacterium]|nr:HD domain-containing protein [Anaerolineales bacterium]